MMKSSPLEFSSHWECGQCKRRVETDIIDAEVDKLEQRMNEVDASDPEKLEELLFCLYDHSLLHPHHYIILELSHSLIFAYNGKTRLTRPEMDRKIQLCHLVLDTLGRVDPGFTEWRGKLLNELSNTLLLISRSDYAKKLIKLPTYKRRIFLCMKNVALAKKCLNLGFSEAVTK